MHTFHTQGAPRSVARATGDHRRAPHWLHQVRPGTRRRGKDGEGERKGRERSPLAACKAPACKSPRLQSPIPHKARPPCPPRPGAVPRAAPAASAAGRRGKEERKKKKGGGERTSFPDTVRETFAVSFLDRKPARKEPLLRRLPAPSPSSPRSGRRRGRDRDCHDSRSTGISSSSAHEALIQPQSRARRRGRRRGSVAEAAYIQVRGRKSTQRQSFPGKS